MSKKIISVILSIMLVCAIGAFSVAAEAGEYATPNAYVPSTDAADVGFYRYFFVLPEDWCNEYTNEAGIYWWSGTDACGAVDGTGGTVKWPGYKIYKYGDNKANVWYCDVPKDVPTIIFNNALDGGEKSWDNFDEVRYLKAVQTTDIPVEYYDPGESDNYPDGTENFNNMIYVVDPEKTAENFDGKLTYVGEWYYYHGDGQWDTQLNPVYGGAEGEAPHVSAGETEPETIAPVAPAETTAPATTAPAAQTGATSSVSSADEPTQNTTVAGNGTIATGSMSLAVVLLVVAAAVTGFVIVLRKREIEK